MKQKLLTLMTLLVLCVTGAWANQTNLITNVTLPDMPTASLDLASQTIYTPDANGWIVFNAYSDIATSPQPSWWTFLGTRASQSPQSNFKQEGSTTTAPFKDANTGFKINKYSPDAAIRFTGAEKASFLVSARSTTKNKEMYIALFTYDSGSTPSQVQFGTTLVTSSKDPQELIFNNLSTSNIYVAYIYGGSDGQNGSLMEIALKAPAGPKITSQTMADANYVEGTAAEDVTALSVSATGTGTLYYQWFSNTTKSTEGAVSVQAKSSESGANTYKPSAASAGTKYYYCAVTDDNGTANSNFATINVSAPTAPTINVTGAGNVARGSDLMLEATVTAVPDITYIKWYACDSEGTVSGNPLGEEPTYAPSTSTVGTYYYRAVVNNGIGGDASHDVYSAVQTINVLPQAPTFLPVAGAVFAGSTVELSSADDAEIYYTTNGVEPTVDPANLYSAPITVDAAMTIKAIAVKSGLNSATASAAYTIKDVATPVISKKGIVASGTKVTITSTDGNAATIYYTLDGSDPRTSGTKQTYSAPVSITSSCTLNAVAKVNSTFSNSASAVFTVSNATVYTYEYGPTKTSPSGADFTVPEAENPTTVVITYHNDGEWNDKNDATPAYFQGKSNPTITDGIPTAGSYITLTPSQDGTITFIGYSGAAKDFYIKKYNGTQILKSSTPSTSGLYEFEFDVEANVLYYVYVTGSKIMFHGLTFTTKFTAIDVKVGSTGWASYISDQNLDFGKAEPKDLKAYAATYGAENITLTDVTEVPANKGIVLQGTANTTYTVPVLASTDAEVTTDLKGSATTDYAVNQNDYKYYVLANVGGEQGFYQYTGTAAIPAGKAFFEETAGGAKFLSLIFAEEEQSETTGINAVETSIADGATLYNLAGQKVGKDYKGIVIVNGKKVIRK